MSIEDVVNGIAARNNERASRQELRDQARETSLRLVSENLIPRLTEYAELLKPKGIVAECISLAKPEIGSALIVYSIQGVSKRGASPRIIFRYTGESGAGFDLRVVGWDGTTSDLGKIPFDLNDFDGGIDDAVRKGFQILQR
ncbi:MAG: hypothetical protein KDD67_13740 [Ignavibacteriae bacterium]|nr:hypothetical protein [Ignavibacteriota bacterium]MCB9216151.1 hypothetical protein [Ignavibacteria bacterium]